MSSPVKTRLSAETVADYSIPPKAVKKKADPIQLQDYEEIRCPSAAGRRTPPAGLTLTASPHSCCKSSEPAAIMTRTDPSILQELL